MSVGAETAAQVRVLVVPMVLDRTNVLHVASVPAESVRVPLIVVFAVIINPLTPADARPAIVMFLAEETFSSDELVIAVDVY
jgi:hypothetical protein